MLLTVEELRTYINTDLSDQVLENKILALELLIRAYTHNNFQKRKFRTTADIIHSKFIAKETCFFNTGDTIQVSNTNYNDGLYVIDSIDNYQISVKEENLLLSGEKDVLLTKIDYPKELVLGAIDMLKWEIEFEAKNKVGIQSETLSRHSVTYYNINDNNNSCLGYPKALTSFLNLYKKARF